MSACVSTASRVCSARGRQKKKKKGGALVLLKLELQAVMCTQNGCREPNPGPVEEQLSAFIHGAISPATHYLNFILISLSFNWETFSGSPVPKEEHGRNPARCTKLSTWSQTAAPFSPATYYTPTIPEDSPPSLHRASRLLQLSLLPSPNNRTPPFPSGLAQVSPVLGKKLRVP